MLEEFERERFSQLMRVITFFLVPLLATSFLSRDYSNAIIGLIYLVLLGIIRKYGLTYNLRLGVYSAIGLTTFLLTLSALLTYGLDDMAILGFFIPLAFAAIIGSSNVFAITFATIFSALSLIYIATELNFITRSLVHSSIYRFSTFIIFLAIMAVVLWRVSRDVKSALSVAENEQMKAAPDSGAWIDRSFVDPMTGLLNLFWVETKFQELSKRAALNNHGTAFIRIYFSSINKSLFLQDVIFREQFSNEVARILGQVFRSQDAIGSIGYHDFIVMITDFKATDDLDMMDRLCNKILQKFSSPIVVNDFQISVECNIGTSISLDNSEHFESPLRRCEIALSFSKEKGGNTYCVHSDLMNMTIANQLAKLEELRDGIRNQEFAVVYQPRFNVLDGTLIGSEALVRWRSKEEEEILPEDFFSLAESSGLVNEIDRFVLDEAAKQIAIWSKSPAMSRINVSVNISEVLLGTADFERFLISVIEKHGVSPRNLSIEVSSRTLTEQSDAKRDILRRMSAIGIGINVDDSGLGQTSINHLVSLKVDFLSIGKKIVHSVATDLHSKELIRSFIQLGKLKDVKILAKGIESQESLNKLTELGCEFGQGWHWSKGLSAIGFEEFARKHNERREEKPEI